MKKTIVLLVSLFFVSVLTKCSSTKDDMSKYLPLLLSQPNFTGDAEWARSVSAGPHESGFRSVSIGNDGVYAAGIIENNDTYTFGTHNVNGVSPSESNPVLVKYDWDGNAVWAKSTEAGPLTDAESGFASVATGGGAIYAAGLIEGNITDYTFGDQDVKGSYAGGNALLVKYDSNGNALWARSTAEGINTSEFVSVSVRNNAVYAAGTIREGDPYIFGTQTVTGPFATHKNALLVKYDANGSALWAKSATTGPDRSGFNAVAAGSDGAYAAGFIMGNAEFVFGTRSVQGDYDLSFNAVLVKYDANGNALWARSVAAGPNASYFNSVSVGSDGIYVAGYITGTDIYTFGDQSVNGTSALNNAVLVKYDTDGNAVWAKTVAAGSDISEFYSVHAGSGGIYAAGYMNGTGTYTFSDQSVQGTSASNNVVLVQYDTDGNAIWARSVTAGASDSVYNSVAAGRKGIFAAGQIYGTGTYSFDAGSLINANGTCATENNALLVKYQ